MSRQRFGIIMAIMMGLSLLWTSSVRANCIQDGKEIACESPRTCTPKGCRSAIDCTDDNDCRASSTCKNYRCTCRSDGDCGPAGECFRVENGTGVCRHLNEPLGCADKPCSSNADCYNDVDAGSQDASADAEDAGSLDASADAEAVRVDGPMVCTFFYDTTSKRCCPRAAAENEPTFACGIRSLGAFDDLTPFGAALILSLACAIRSRRRLAATRRSSGDASASPIRARLKGSRDRRGPASRHIRHQIHPKPRHEA